jgi:hypothetical protein
MPLFSSVTKAAPATPVAQSSHSWATRQQRRVAIEPGIR